METNEPFFVAKSYFKPLPIRAADPETFQVLNALYAKDGKNVFYRYGKISKADPVSFRVLDPGYFHAPQEYSLDHLGTRRLPYFQGYARDDQSVFHYVDTIGQPASIKGVDLASFEVLKRGFARDRDHVYHEKSRLKAAKPEEFRQLSQFFSLTSRAVFYLDRVLEGADPNSFRILNDDLSADDKAVYLSQRKIEGADPATYQAVGTSSVGKDRFRAYCQWEPIDEADPETFESAGGLYQKDRNQVYFLGKAIPVAKPASFRFVRENWGEDDCHVFQSGHASRKA